jgi:transposase
VCHHLPGALPHLIPSALEEVLMSLHPHPTPPVPEDTARVARAAFPTGNPSLTLREAVGTIFQADDFAPLFPPCGQPGFPPWRLALVTIRPCREHVADRQAAEAVRARIDWKYLLSLALTDPGCDFSVRSELRDRLLSGSKEVIIGQCPGTGGRMPAAAGIALTLVHA